MRTLVLKKGLKSLLRTEFYFFTLRQAWIHGVTHLIHPPFYPIQRLISLNHIKEILSVFYFSVSPGIFFILYIYFFYREDWNRAIQKKENIALLFGVLSFLFHGFFLEPSIGVSS